MLAQTYNSLIEAFGNKFNEFSYRELATFCTSLSKVGLRHEEIISESVQRVISAAGKQEASEEETTPAKSSESYQIGFRSVIVPFFLAINHLELTNGDDLIAKLTDEKFIKRAVTGKLSFFE